MRRILLTLFFLFSFIPIAFAAEPQRSQGLSVHMLPKRVAALGGRPWGFSVDFSPRLKVENKLTVFQSPDALLSFLRIQDLDVQKNGIWLVFTAPEAYSAQELSMLNELKTLCTREKIPLFLCRATELPDGWKRYGELQGSR